MGHNLSEILYVMLSRTSRTSGFVTDRNSIVDTLSIFMHVHTVAIIIFFTDFALQALAIH
jgi:hypothetical protein